MIPGLQVGTSRCNSLGGQAVDEELATPINEVEASRKGAGQRQGEWPVPPPRVRRV